MVPLNSACFYIVFSACFTRKLWQGTFTSTHFLPNYRNPCWREPLPTGNSYLSNVYRTYPETRGPFKELSQRWDNLRKERDHSRTWRLRCLPYFYIAGLAKTGTTDLYRSLAEHPDVTLPMVKEPHWWTMGRIGKTAQCSETLIIFLSPSLIVMVARKLASTSHWNTGVLRMTMMISPKV